MATANGPPPYTVSASGAARDQIRQLARRAIRAGLRREFFDDLRSANHRLRHDPGSWGDRLRDYRHAGLGEYRAMSSVLIVHYGVHEASRQVFVREVRLSPYSPLAESDSPE
ncbi:MAG TPA: hypothetical protein VM533_21645 [Fimbriiglobus sp.]|jgi:hypothetical protein|nr:hypothetical protein [Fimbriiglobus sp.]